MQAAFYNKYGQLRSGWRIVIFAVLIAALVAIVNIGWRALGVPMGSSAGKLEPWLFLAFVSLIAAGGLGMIVLMLRCFERRGLAAIALRFERPAVQQLASGTLLGALPISLLMALALAFGYGEISTQSIDGRMLLSQMLPALVTGIIVAAWEELVLRGYLLRQFSLGSNAATAAVVTGVIFGLLHSGNPGANWQGLLFTIIGGIMMAWLLFRSGSLWLLIGYHFGWNTMASAVFGLTLSGLADQASLFKSTLTGSRWLTGGDYGFEASLPAVVFEFLVLSTMIFITYRSAIWRRSRRVLKAESATLYAESG